MPPSISLRYGGLSCLLSIDCSEKKCLLKRKDEHLNVSHRNVSSLQMAKVGVAICEARTGQSEAGDVVDVDEDNAEPMVVEEAAATQSVKPAAFKSLIGKGHPEFSSARQQASRRTATSLQLLHSSCDVHE